MARTKTKEDLINQLYAYFISQGFSKVGASYMVGSLIQESRLDPAVHQGDGVGFGLAQVSIGKESYKALVKYAKDHNRYPDDFVVQAHFIVQQRTGVTKLFKNAKTEAQAAAAVKAYESFGKEGNRSTYGKTIYANINAGNPAGQGMGGEVSAKVASDADYIIWDLQQSFTDDGADDPVTQCKTGPDAPAEKSVHAAIIPKK